MHHWLLLWITDICASLYMFAEADPELLTGEFSKMTWVGFPKLKKGVSKLNIFWEPFKTPGSATGLVEIKYS